MAWNLNYSNFVFADDSFEVRILLDNEATSGSFEIKMTTVENGVARELVVRGEFDRLLFWKQRHTETVKTKEGFDDHE